MLGRAAPVSIADQASSERSRYSERPEYSRWARPRARSRDAPCCGVLTRTTGQLVWCNTVCGTGPSRLLHRLSLWWAPSTTSSASRAARRTASAGCPAAATRMRIPRGGEPGRRPASPATGVRPPPAWRSRPAQVPPSPTPEPPLRISGVVVLRRRRSAAPARRQRCARCPRRSWDQRPGPTASRAVSARSRPGNAPAPRPGC